MKRNLLKKLFLLLGATSALSAVAFDVKVGDGYYNLEKSSQTASLTYFVYYSSENGTAYVGDLVIPETIEHEGVVYTVTSIDPRAFNDCKNLTSIELPSTITTIGNNAFFNCTGLKSVKFPSKLTTLEYSAFQNCSALEEIELPSSLSTLNNAVFSGCQGLRSVKLPAYLNTIGSSAFYECTSLATIEFPRSLLTISPRAFSLCTSLESLVFPDGLKKIETSAFQECTGLKRVEFGKSLQVLDVNCFTDCKQLADVYFSSPQPPTEVFSNSFNNAPRERLHLPNEGIDTFCKLDVWLAFKSILPHQCAAPYFTLDGQTITFATTTNLNYTKTKEEFTYSIEVSDLNEGVVTYEDMEELGALQLTYDIRVKATAEGCADSDEVAAQLSWVDFNLIATDADDIGTTAIDAPVAKRPVLATSSGGEVTLSGLADGERVVLYDLSGRQLSATTASGGSASFSAVSSGQVVIVRVAGSSFKIRVN